MYMPDAPGQYYELHYVLNGLKKLVTVEKSGMSELHAWLCVLMIVREQTTGRPTNSNKQLPQAIESAFELGITNVRWNRQAQSNSNKPSIKFSIASDGASLNMTTGGSSLEKYRNNMP